MRMLSLAVALLLLARPGLLLAQTKTKDVRNPHIADTDPRTPQEQLKTFHLPPGFEIQLVAAEPKIKKPINIAFDARGRLWVTGSEEYPFPAPAGRPGKDTVKILDGIGADGLARQVTTFADGLNIPIGVLPTEQGALVYSIPNIYHLVDSNGDGVADRRDVLYSGYGYKDTHGMTGEFMWGFDGWVYCCHGFANTSTVKSATSPSITMQSGNTYRIKPDGSRIEYFTHGQVNPFGLAFDPLGNLYSTDCHTRPLYQLLKGAYYPSFGKPHDGMGFGPEMVTHDHGSTAIAGIAYYAADRFPPEFRDNLFVGNVVTNRINRDRLERHGSTYKGIALEDFVRCDDPWFRPVDIKLGPDGALYVADFYNRIIGHYEVPLNHPGRDRERGRIWRIVYRGADDKLALQPVRDLTRASVADLVEELSNPNLAVRMQATNRLVAQGTPAAAAVGKGWLRLTPVQQAHGLWILARLGKLDDATLSLGCSSKEALVRVHAQRVLSEATKLSDEQRKQVLAGLGDNDAFVRRAAAEALGSHLRPENIAPLLKCLHATPTDDTHLRHAVRLALRDQLRLPESWVLLQSETVAAKDARSLAEICLGVHDVASADFLAAHLRQQAEPMDTWTRYAHHVARFGKEKTAAALLEVSAAKLTPVGQARTFKAVNQGLQEAGRALPSDCRRRADELATKLLTSDAADSRSAGVELAAALRLAGPRESLLALATRPATAEGQRTLAVTALLDIEPKAYIPVFEKMLANATEAVEFREQIARSLAATNQPAAHVVLVKTLQSAPARLQTSIALALASSGAGGEKLLQAVGEGKASARLLQDKGIEARLRQARVARLDERLAKLTKGLPAADDRLLGLLATRRAAFGGVNADPVVGVKVFEKHCAACHQLANKGAKIGPQLDGIGMRGLDRLLEDILDPSRNVDQAFRATTLVLDNGQLVTGLLLRQEGQVYLIADAQGKEVRVPAGRVQERLVAQLSPMPANLVEQIPEADFYHLLGYLLAQRPKN